MKKNHHLILIPTYNEASNCIQIIDAIKNINTKAPAAFDICFIDDNSPDGTSDLIQKNKDRLYPNNIHIINRQYKKGLGPAYMAGFHFSIQSNYNYVYQLDCDFSHNPEDCLQLQQNLINGADFVIGSRYCKGGATKNWAALREIISRSAAIYIFLMTGLPIKDPTAGFSGINVSLLKKLLSFKPLSTLKGYGFQVALKYSAWKNNATIIEHPICFHERRVGQSKFNKLIIIEAILKIPTLRKYKW